MVHHARNKGTVPVVIYIATLLRTGEPAAIPDWIAWLRPSLASSHNHRAEVVEGARRSSHLSGRGS